MGALMRPEYRNTMSKLIRSLTPTLLLIIHLTCVPCRADYIGSVREAISNIEIGAYNEAAASIEKALAFEETEPLAHMAMGVVYLHTGGLSEAEKAFSRAASLDPRNWQAQYALALIATLQKKTQIADQQLSLAAREPDAADEVAAFKDYLSVVAGKAPSHNSSSLHSPLAVEVAAISALASGRSDEARALFERVLAFPVTPGFEENRAPLATFDPKQPIVLPKGKLTWKPIEHKNAPVVTGMVVLKADVNRNMNVSFVTFYVDDQFVGVTNYWPFQFNWNTENYPNGYHQIRIEGKDDLGNVVSKKSVWVRVENRDPKRAIPREGPDVSELRKRLWECIRLSESRKVAHYNLALLYQKSNDRDKAIAQMEYAVAYQPSYKDARKLLNALRGRQAVYTEVTRGPSDSKRIALTFDDGPNERTAEMLEMLAKLNVPATFFVVGFRAECQPELIKAMVDAGHEVQNHSYTHPNLTALTPDQVELELSKANAVVRAITGKPALYFRPPGGHADQATKQGAARQGFTGVFWTVMCSQFEGSNYDALASHVINNASPGGIILMHNGEPATTSALPRIVGELRKQGYEFVTISQLLSGAR